MPKLKPETVSRRIRDAEIKAEIAAISIHTKAILETIIEVYGLCERCSDSSLLRTLKEVQRLQKAAPEDAKIGEIAIAFMEAQIARIRANLAS